MIEEAEALERLRQGDIEALDVLVVKYQVRALRAAFLITHEKLLAEDIVQNAFIRVYERINQYRGDGPFAAWFIRMVVNDALKAVARRKGKVSLEEFTEDKDFAIDPGLLLDMSPGPEELLLQAETHQQIIDAFNKLSPDQRAVIVLRYYLKLSENEMARQLACPPGTVSRRLHVARHKLRTLLSVLVPG